MNESHPERPGGARRLLCACLGGQVVDLAWRIAGVSMYLHWLAGLRANDLGPYLAERPLALHVAGLGGLALVAWGPRPAALLPLAAAWSWLAYAVPAGRAGPMAMVVDEYALYALLPLLACLAAIITWSEGQASLEAHDRAQKWVLRAGLTAALGFAALHKLNADFLDPASSCAGLARRLQELWAVGAIEPGPWAIVALEGLAAPLLWFWPRLGLAWTVALAAGLGHIGPVGFNALVVAAALAFVPECDVAGLRAWLRGRGGSVATLALLLAPASLAAYRGPAAWTSFAIFQATLLLASLLALVGVVAELRAGRWTWRPRRPRLALPGGPRLRRFALAVWVGLVALGVSPYLGLKYRYSFAMLSNLRVDDARWNSLVVPRALRLTAHDPFVHVLRVEPRVPAAKKGDPALAPGVYAPQEFRARFEEARRQGRRSALELRYQGQTLRSPDLTVDMELLGFAASLPTRPLVQSALALRGPQRCVH